MIVQKKIKELIPYARNARTHSDEQVRQLAGSIKEFGFTNPVLIQADGGIIAGHGRVMAAELLKMNEVPCLVIGEDWSQTKIKAYILADNKLAMNSGWDEGLLALELEEIKLDESFDIELIGFDDEELEYIFDGESEIDYSILDEDDKLSELEGDVQKSIQIPFTQDDYVEAVALIKSAKEQSLDYSLLFIAALKAAL